MDNKSRTVGDTDLFSRHFMQQASSQPNCKDYQFFINDIEFNCYVFVCQLHCLLSSTIRTIDTSRSLAAGKKKDLISIISQHIIAYTHVLQIHCSKEWYFSRNKRNLNILIWDGINERASGIFYHTIIQKLNSFSQWYTFYGNR